MTTSSAVSRATRSRPDAPSSERSTTSTWRHSRTEGRWIPPAPWASTTPTTAPGTRYRSRSSATIAPRPTAPSSTGRADDLDLQSRCQGAKAASCWSRPALSQGLTRRAPAVSAPLRRTIGRFTVQTAVERRNVAALLRGRAGGGTRTPKGVSPPGPKPRSGCAGGSVQCHAMPPGQARPLAVVRAVASGGTASGGVWLASG
jgi:hypothetical protein